MLPQLIKMHMTQSVDDVLIMTFIMLFFICLLWVLYGLIHKEKALTINNFS